MAPYILCSRCSKPLINEENLLEFRSRTIKYAGGSAVVCGALGVFALPLLGFGAAGITSGSIAAAWQSSLGLVAAGSTFALLQSLGATGIGMILFGSIGAVGGGGALALIRANASLFGWCECDKDAENTNLRVGAPNDEDRRDDDSREVVPKDSTLKDSKDVDLNKVDFIKGE